MNAAWRWITSFSHCIHLERFCSAEMFLSCVTTRCSFKPVHARISDSIPRVIVGVISGLPSGRGNISLEVNIWTNSPFSPAFPSVADFHLFHESLQTSASTWKSQKIQPSLHFLSCGICTAGCTCADLMCEELMKISLLLHLLPSLQVERGHAVWLFNNQGKEGVQQSFRRDRQIWPGPDC